MKIAVATCSISTSTRPTLARPCTPVCPSPAIGAPRSPSSTISAVFDDDDGEEADAADAGTAADDGADYDE